MVASLNLRSGAAMSATIRSLPAAKPGDFDYDWLQQLARGSNGYLGDERNILIALRGAPELAELVRFNEFSLQVEFNRTPPWREVTAGAVWTECDDTQLMAWLQERDLRVRNQGAIAGCVAVVSQDCGYHPVRDYLSALAWDGSPRLEHWTCDYLCAEADPLYLAAVGAKFLTSAVARILCPGCQADHVLVLEGLQGMGKTSAARILAVRSEWYAGNLPDIQTKDAALQLCGRWIIEIAELKAIRTSQIEATKTFLTQCVDTFRPPYGRRTGQFPRQCVFIGTTNESEYLRDRTGNRRYWPVSCRRIDLVGLEQVRDQLWAEAVHRFKQGTVWHLTPEEALRAEEEQGERVHVPELEHQVRAYLDGQGGRDEITVHDVLVYGLNFNPDDASYARDARSLGPAVAEALEQCGWHKDRRRGRDKRTTYLRGGQG
jgi:predicted P-loop ATPase